MNDFLEFIEDLNHLEAVRESNSFDQELDRLRAKYTDRIEQFEQDLEAEHDAL